MQLEEVTSEIDPLRKKKNKKKKKKKRWGGVIGTSIPCLVHPYQTPISIRTFIAMR